MDPVKEESTSQRMGQIPVSPVDTGEQQIPPEQRQSPSVVLDYLFFLRIILLSSEY